MRFKKFLIFRCKEEYLFLTKRSLLLRIKELNFIFYVLFKIFSIEKFWNFFHPNFVFYFRLAKIGYEAIRQLLFAFRANFALPFYFFLSF